MRSGTRRSSDLPTTRVTCAEQPVWNRKMLEGLNDWLFATDLQALPRWHRTLRGWIRVLAASVREIADGELEIRSASLVYTTLLSFVPLLAFSFAILKGFGVHND